MIHCSTVEERVSLVSQMLSKPTHGLISQLSRSHHVSRQTLYRWATKGRQALSAAFEAPQVPSKPKPPHAFLVLTLLLETHASYRGIQTCLRELHGLHLSLGTIAGIVKEAGLRAQSWLKQQQAPTARTLALDEQYSSQRGKAYLNVIDVHSGQVWATVPPVAVDGESWTLLLWYLSEQGIEAKGTVSDGGRAIADAVTQVYGSTHHQRDIWHLLHLASQVQARLDRTVSMEQERLPAMQRNAERATAGKATKGRPSGVTLAQQQARIAQMQYVAQSVDYLCGHMRQMVEVVVVHQGRLLSSQERQGEIEAVLDLLDELALLATTAMQKHIQMLSKHLRLALPQTLLFARELDARNLHAARCLGSEAVALLAWAWRRRTVIGPSSTHLLKAIPSAWREEAAVLLTAWDQAVRASSVVENWHSIVRPHLAVHRTLSAGFLALLAVWHNHRIAPRGLHEDLSPLQRTGTASSDHFWLAALGYSALAA